MSDRDVIIRELERDGWMVVEDRAGYLAVHPSATDRLKFGGKLGWNLRIIRRQAAEALGKHTVRSSAKRHKISKASEDARLLEARIAHLNERDKTIARENARRRVITRRDELRALDSMMRDTGTAPSLSGRLRPVRWQPGSPI